MLAMTRRTPSDGDAELVEAARGGDRRAYGALVEKHQRLVFAVVSRLVRPAGLGEEVEDLAQEAFLRAFRGLDRFDPNGTATFRTWLLKVATNLALDRLKRRRTEPPLRLVPDQPFPADRPTALAQLRDRIERAVGRLSDEHRAVFIMREIHDLSYAEIGEVLGLTSSGARVRMFRAREALGHELAEWREGTDV